jgi:hypothetical protein
LVNLEQYVDMHVELLEKHPEAKSDYWQWFKSMGQHFGPNEIDKVESRRIQKLHSLKIKECYYNSWLIHQVRSEYRYFEGFVHSGIPIEHAWLVKDGKVVDPTLAVVVGGDADRFGSEYFGVEIPQLSRSQTKIPNLRELFEQEVIL